MFVDLKYVDALPTVAKIMRAKIVNEYGQEIPQSQTAGKPMATRGRATQNHETSGRQTKQSNQLSLPLQDDCKIRTDIKSIFHFINHS